ncbi:branched-chain amino acid ABC transporter permease [Bradyrhizobium sp. CIR3A]|uniref:branched-chain amino acid ABC transporter permease n=1 Tax=Bradyrhizobium sp. CIR3A TaxID=2663838 RepID=UPI001605C3A3|nr:branched-chain amino acid ABC transporter permease [Bradyrhizobium sp. CIR3A]MBB4261356.1 branched-chain amino acid transport system permease protein [Bradyrhizobium sp. CIR3A]
MAYWFTVATLAGVNVLLAYSVYASFMSGQVSIGQAAFFGIGAYVGASLTVLAGFDLASACLIAGFAGAALSLVVGIPTLRLRGYHFTIATVAFAEAVRVVLHNVRYGRPRTGGAVGDQWLGPDGPVGFRHINYLNEHAITTGQFALAVWIVVILVLIGFFALERSRTAILLRTIAEDDVVARSIGIPIARYKVVAFACGGFLAGIAGCLYAHLLTFISGNDFVIHLSTIALAYVVIGGSQTMWGPLLGATIFTVLPEVLRPIQEFRLELFGLLILLVMLFRPAGLISAGMVRRWFGSRRKPNQATPQTV